MPPAKDLGAFLRRKRIVLSSFSQSKRHKGARLYSIAFHPPEACKGWPSVPAFFPTEFMLAQSKCGAMSREEYVSRFQALLVERRATISRIVPQLPDGAVLCCWCSLKPSEEKPHPFCHRQLVAAFLEREFGIAVEVE